MNCSLGTGQHLQGVIFEPQRAPKCFGYFILEEPPFVLASSPTRYEPPQALVEGLTSRCIPGALSYKAPDVVQLELEVGVMFDGDK